MRFEDLKLAIATQFDLTIIGQDYKRHSCQARLIGYQKPMRLMVELLNKPPQVLVHHGLKIEGEISNALGQAHFESAIDEFVQGSSPYLTLEYPTTVNYTSLRAEPRVPVDEPIEVIGKTALGMDTSAMHGYILDVSRTGARIVIEKELTSMVTHISMGVKLSTQGLERNMDLLAKVVAISKTSDGHPEYGFAYGLQFLELQEIDQYFLQAYCYKLELQSRQLPCYR